jgi:hypothetical protein
MKHRSERVPIPAPSTTSQVHDGKPQSMFLQQKARRTAILNGFRRQPMRSRGYAVPLTENHGETHCLNSSGLLAEILSDRSMVRNASTARRANSEASHGQTGSNRGERIIGPQSISI